MKMCEDFAPNFRDKRTCCGIKTTHHNTPFLTRAFFYQKQHDCHPPPTLFSLFSQLKLKLKGLHFDTIGVIEAELQAVLNALTEQDLQDAFKKLQKHWEWCICVEGDYFEGEDGQ
jgi:hypothetical protein